MVCDGKLKRQLQQGRTAASLNGRLTCKMLALTPILGSHPEAQLGKFNSITCYLSRPRCDLYWSEQYYWNLGEGAVQKTL
jgi:hypothetical protein